MRAFSLSQIVNATILIAIIITALILGETFFKPMVLAALLAMLFLPLCRWLENKGLQRGLTAIICTLIIVIVFTGLAMVITWQISDLSKDLSQVEEQLKQIINNLKSFIQDRTGISRENRKQLLSSNRRVLRKTVGTF